MALNTRICTKLAWGTCLFSLIVIGTSFVASSTFAQEEEVHRRLEAAKEQIREMINHGEALLAEGREEEAAAAFARAEAMEREVGAWLERVERELAQRGEREQERPRERRERQGDHYIASLEHLERAMGILNENGNTELAAQIDQVANQIRERVSGREGRGEREREVEEEHPERRMARFQIELIKAALPALREANRGDAVELAELAIRAREVGLEGRRDEEAQAIRERAPNREDLRRILGMSIELYQEFGMGERAEDIARGVREAFPQRERREEGREEGRREEGREEGREQGREEGREEGREGRSEEQRETRRESAEADAQIERLQRHLAELEAAIKQTHEEIARLRRDDR